MFASANEVIFSPTSVCLSVSLSLYLLTELLKNNWSSEILWNS